MKVRKIPEAKKVSPVDNRKAFVRQLLSMAEFTIRRSNETDEKAEAIEWERLLKARLEKLNEQISVAA